MDDDLFLSGREHTSISMRSPSGMDGGLVNDHKDTQYNFLEPLDKAYECPVCCEVLNHPVLFEKCGHRCCANCLGEVMRGGGKCPIDQTVIDRDRDVMPDNVFQQEIDLLQLKCSFVDRGCSWYGTMKDIKAHLDDCKFVPVMCPKRCGKELEKSMLRAHLQEDCPKREVKCDFCNIPITVEQEESHLTVCGKFMIPCPNECKKGEIPREELQDHLENKCPQQQVPCPFHDAGCEFMSKRKHLHKHIKDDPIQHLAMACDVIIKHKKVLDDNDKLLTKHSDSIQIMERKVSTLEKLYGCQLVWKIEKWEYKMEEAKLGRKTTIFSPPFLTARHGYKMAMSICPYGDGRARGKFLSIFICICKGEYDALLGWPFCHRISFTLVDQCQDPAARRNVTYSIKPNIIRDNKAFLGRPIGERNASFGAQKFVELEVIKEKDYIRDDCVFIKCTIDSDDMILL
ncbi:TNF receptor-associated factor 4 [Magallana gigas]|uniref:TNF receptor-associated factor 4 n=1 Tax=Magallana gigas TaxID=29159 RepID=UPI000975369D|eukprot:XP_011456656.2 PREDICTED: TNF receptor-associated factor 4 [Crassostrea gigas]